jgi:hypothetical protein
VKRHPEICAVLDGSLARRSGVKFLGDHKGWHTLLGRFIVELGEG